MNKPSSPRLLLIVPVLAAVVALVLGGIFMPGPLAENKTLVIAHGTSGREIASQLAENGVVSNSFLFRIARKLLARSDALKAGEYAFTPHQSIADIVAMIRDGRSVIREFTVAEGLTSVEIVELLNNDPVLTGNIAAPPEGSLLPETYRYSHGDARAVLLARMQKAMSDTLEELWPKRDPGVPLKSPHEAVIMAAVIEKETGKPEERARIAGVFYNRLKYPMRLQSDPTVIYGITQGLRPLGRALGRDDLTVPSSYNTYTNDGLPSGPICNPGRASLEAALHPERNDFLYFVADGAGGHTFARDLATHNQNVSKWIGVRPKETPLPPKKPEPQKKNP